MSQFLAALDAPHRILTNDGIAAGSTGTHSKMLAYDASSRATHASTESCFADQ